MSAVVDYASLKTAFTRYAVFDDVIDAFDTFLSLSENRINRDLRVPEMVESATRAFVIGDNGQTGFATGDFGTSLPSAPILEFISIAHSTGGALQEINPERLLRLGSHWDTSGGVPDVYAVAGNALLFAPNPTGQSVTFYYYREVPPLTPSAPSNSVIDKYGGLYLYAVMLEASSFLGDAEGEAAFMTMYERTRQVVNQGGARSETNPSNPPTPMPIQTGTA